MSDRWLEGLVPKRERKKAELVEEELPVEEDGRVPVVEWTPVVCKKCGERHRIKINKTLGKVRYHICLACGSNFKSVEVFPQGGN